MEEKENEKKQRAEKIGNYAKKVKEISQDTVHGEIERIANNYTKYSSWFDEHNDAPKK